MYYEGSEVDWKGIRIDAGNLPLTYAARHYGATHICTLTEIPAKAPTYSQGGNRAYWICSFCGKVYKDSQGKVETTVEAEKLPRRKLSATTLTKVTGGAKSFTATWNPMENADGYMVHYSTDSKFTTYKSVMFKGGATTTATVKNLNAGTYYVRIKAYRLEGNTKVYASASNAMTVTVQPVP